MSETKLTLALESNKTIDTLGIGVVPASMNAAAKMQIDSTTQGFLPPRMTTAQRTAIVSPPVGLVVYDTTLGQLFVNI